MSSHSRQLTARFKITTPMFLAGADQEEVLTSIRPPSVKGALRFWWRALNWARVRALHSSDKAALHQLHKEEGKLFGGAHIHGRDEQGKEVVWAEQSRVTIRVKDQTIRKDEGLHQQIGSSPNLRYLLGMGLCKGKVVTRTALQGSFTLELRFLPSATCEQFQQVEETLLCFGLLGALGSRARHGWGSISIQSLMSNDEQHSVPANQQAYRNCIRQLLQPCNAVTEEPPYSAFYSHSRVDISTNSSDYWSLLRLLGEEQQRYRTRNQSVGELEENFNDDRDLAYQVARGNHVDTHPQRIVLGLPHHYNLQGAEKIQCDVQPVGKIKYRRASPLFIHIHQFPETNDYLMVQTLLQSCFLPKDLKIQMRQTRDEEGEHASVVPAKEDWQVIHNFMDRFPTRETLYGH